VPQWSDEDEGEEDDLPRWLLSLVLALFGTSVGLATAAAVWRWVVETEH
jgi:hypothetical protein